MSTLDMERIYLQFSGKVTGYLQARLHNMAAAEDLCAEVFEKALRKQDGYDPEKSSLGTWIFTITRNTLIDYYRRQKPNDELDENLADETEIDEDLLSGETLSELAGALRKLPQQMMDIIVLRYYDGKPLTEIAAIMQMSYGAVKLRHQNALTMLREELKYLRED